MRLYEDLQDALVFSQTNAEHRALLGNIVERVERELLNRRGAHRPLTEDEQARNPGLRAVVLDRTITELVETELQGSELRVRKVLYALYARGRHDRQGRTGWTDAGDVLRWITKEFPHLDHRAPHAPAQTRQFRWSPPLTTAHPKRVIKRGDRKPADFEYERFVRSIEKIVVGRRNSKVLADNVARWVLDNAGGQPVVHSSQLAVGVLECLRRVDDIAFLRCAIIVKGYDSVGAIADEALAMTVNPSARLIFEPAPTKEVQTGEPLVS